MRRVGGLDYRDVLERAIPGALEQAVADADILFGQELPAVWEWSLGREEARRITQPVLAVLGAKSGAVAATFGEQRESLLARLPKAEALDLPDASLLLHARNPSGMVEGSEALFEHHSPSARTRVPRPP